MEKKTKTGHKSLKFVLYSLLFLITIPVLLIVIVQIPAVQNFAKNKITQALEEKLQAEVKIERVHIGILRDVYLKGVYLEAQDKDTLLYAEELGVSIGFLQLLNKEILITQLTLENAYLNAYRPSGSKDFNFSFIAKAFADTTTTTTTKTPWKFDINSITLKNIRLNFLDTAGGAFIQSRLELADLDIQSLGINDQHFKVDDADIKGLFLSFDLRKPEFAGKPSTMAFSINDINVSDSRFIFNNYKNKSIPKGIDYNRMDFSAINGSVSDFYFRQKELKGEVNSLSLKEKSGLDLHELEGSLALQESGIEIKVNRLLTPLSEVDHALSVYVPLSKDASIGKMKMYGNADEERLAFNELLYFLPSADTITYLKGKTLTFSGDLEGTLDDFNFENAALSIDENTSLKGDIAIKGLPDFMNSYVDISLDELRFQGKLADQFLPKKELGVKPLALGNVNVKGSIKGNVLNPDVDLTVNTNAGSMAVDAKFRTDAKFSFLAYSGKASVTSLDLQRLLTQDLKLGKVTMTASATGRDLNVQTFTAKIRSLEYNKYAYNSIDISGSMKDKYINATILSQDANLKTDLKLTGNFVDSNFIVDGKIHNIDFQALHFSAIPLKVKTDLYGFAYGTNPDSIRGNMQFSDFTISNGKEMYEADSIHFIATLDNNYHQFLLKFPEGEGGLGGTFSVKELPMIVKGFSKSYENANYQMPEFPHTEYVELSLVAGDISGLTKFFVPDITKLDSINFHAGYLKEAYSVTLNSYIKDLIVSGKEVKASTIHASGDNDHLQFSIGSQEINAGENFKILQTQATGTFANNQVKFNVKMYDQSAPTRLNVNGEMRLFKDTVHLTFPSAEIVIQNKVWHLNEGNKLTYSSEYLTAKNFIISQGQQRILVNSNLTENENIFKVLFEKVQMTQLSDLAGFSSYKMQGKLNGALTVTDPMATAKGISAKFTVDSIGLNNTYLGDLNLDATKSPEQNNISLNAVIHGPNNDAKVSGTISLAEDQTLDLVAKVDRLSMTSLEPFVKKMVYSLRGQINADFVIKGKTTAPLITGVLNFPGVNRVGVVLSNTVYKVEDQKIYFNESSIQLKQFVLKDSVNNSALANGYIYHTNFKDFKFSLTLRSENFQAVNSEAKDDVLIYGKLYAKMRVEVLGPLDNVIIDVDVTTLKGSKVFLPLASAKAAESLPNYVRFSEIESIDAPDTTGKEDTKSKVVKRPDIDFTKFTVRGHIRATEDAQINIVIDPINGDMISAVGSGVLSLEFDSQNTFKMFGVYTIDNGSYSLSFADLIRKTFKIEKGSTISWTGNVDQAQLNINAVYETRASRYDLIADQVEFMTSEQSNTAKRPLPVMVNLHLAGDLLGPEITFKIAVPEGGDPLTGNLVVQKIDQINNDPNELTRQAFSLVMLSRFMPSGNVSGGTVSGSNLAINEVNQSVSRVLNTQLNQLSDDYLQGFDINVNLQSLDQSYGALAQNAQVMVTKQLNSRISVSAGGNVNLNTNAGSSGQFAGDYNVLYRLNPDGTINLKFFRTSMQNIYTDNLNTQTGASINIKREFNRWSRFFRRRPQNGGKEAVVRN